jgi:glycosyltransferase involved in cell wall biosynthesis
MSKSNGLASIIIPNFNHAQYLGAAIQSVLKQTYGNFEIIVVDDGSTDNSREVVARFGEQVRYIWQENQGLSAARNTGIRAAQGAFVGVLDADDMYELSFLSTLISILEANPDAGAVYCGYRFVDHKNNPLPQIEARQIPAEQLYQDLVDGNFLVPESMLVRRHCYEQVGPFDETLRALEDWDMWLRTTSRFRVIGTHQVLIRHRILPGSMSTDPIRMFDNRMSVLAKHFGPEATDQEEPTSLKRRAYGRAYLISAVEYLQYHDVDRAYELFRKMAEVCPNLLTQMDTFYELGLGDQPKGFRCDFTTLNAENNTPVLLDMLSRLFEDQQLTGKLKGYQRLAYTNAYSALGLLNYGARKFQSARFFLLRAIISDPRYGLKRQLVVTFLKSLLDARFTERIKSSRYKIAPLREENV